jgi:serine/threonine protein kinase
LANVDSLLRSDILQPSGNAPLSASNLLQPAQLDVARRLEIGAEEPRLLARSIVQEGWLTRWQAQQLLAGRTKFFLGKYKLVESLGQGGMGTVLKAEQPGLNRVVALKVMSREVLRNPEAIARFLREIRSAAALEHPNIVRAYDADSVGKSYFLVMEYVEGNDLKSWIRQTLSRSNARQPQTASLSRSMLLTVSRSSIVALARSL